MKCPGLHSVFARLDIRFTPPLASAGSNKDSQLAYTVLRTDARVDRVEIGINNAYANGIIEAFFRAPPAKQAGIQQITTLVSNREFENQNALVVGASRGLRGGPICLNSNTHSISGCLPGV